MGYVNLFYLILLIIALLAEASRLRRSQFRTYRAEKTYAVSSGKWYFEFEILTAGPMRVGWARADCAPGCMLGSDDSTWAFDGYNVRSNILVDFKMNFVLIIRCAKFMQVYVNCME